MTELSEPTTVNLNAASPDADRPYDPIVTPRSPQTMQRREVARRRTWDFLCDRSSRVARRADPCPRRRRSPREGPHLATASPAGTA
jgi:hypothetical protein